MRPPRTPELHLSSTTVDIPRVPLHLQCILLPLVSHTTAMAAKGTSEDSKTHMSCNNRQARTSHRVVAIQSIVHLLVRRQERKGEMESLGDGIYEGCVAGRVVVTDQLHWI